MTSLLASFYSAFLTMNRKPREFRSTTILLVRRDGRVALAGDGQVTMGDTIMKSGARKVRRLAKGEVMVMTSSSETR